MYVAVKGGERAIDHAHRWMAAERRGDPSRAEIDTAQIEAQLSLAVDRVMAEGSCHDRALAALAVKQARGDLIEAAFLLRAFRTTLPRFGASVPLDTAAMRVERRVSATYKDLPGGQVLGPTVDYTHRLLEFALMGAGGAPPPAPAEDDPGDEDRFPRVGALLEREGLMAAEPQAEGEPGDLTRVPLGFPAGRALRLQNLARGDEGFLLGMAYSTQRGFGANHPFVGELRQGEVSLQYVPPELGFAVEIGDLVVTECQMVNQFAGAPGEAPRFTRGYGLVFGRTERRAMAMAIVDRALRAGELGEEVLAPAQDEEFVLSHSDNVEATGFLEHLKLPHYVDFQSELEGVRAMRAAALAGAASATGSGATAGEDAEREAAA